MRIAVSTSDGEWVDLHFGKAEEFHIYDVKDSSLELIDTRPVKPYCTGSPSLDHAAQESKFDIIVKALRDCEMIVTLKIGPGPKAALADEGFKIVECEEKVSALAEKIK